MHRSSPDLQQLEEEEEEVGLQGYVETPKLQREGHRETQVSVGFRWERYMGELGSMTQ